MGEWQETGQKNNQKITSQKFRKMWTLFAQDSLYFLYELQMFLKEERGEIVCNKSLGTKGPNSVAQPLGLKVHRV